MLPLLVRISHNEDARLFSRLAVHFCRIDICRTVHCACFPQHRKKHLQKQEIDYNSENPHEDNFISESPHEGNFISESPHEGNLFLKVRMKAIYF